MAGACQAELHLLTQRWLQGKAWLLLALCVDVASGFLCAGLGAEWGIWWPWEHRKQDRSGLSSVLHGFTLGNEVAERSNEQCPKCSIAGFWVYLMQGFLPCSHVSPEVLYLPFPPQLNNVSFPWQEEFRLERGPQLLALVEDAFSRHADGLQDHWMISLSKPNENDKHLLMTLAGEQGKC